jgi:hypothetical protein
MRGTERAAGLVPAAAFVGGNHDAQLGRELRLGGAGQAGQQRQQRWRHHARMGGRRRPCGEAAARDTGWHGMRHLFPVVLKSNWMMAEKRVGTSPKRHGVNP